VTRLDLGDAHSYYEYDAASQTASILNRVSNTDALSCVYYEYSNDGLPTKQAGAAGLPASGGLSETSWWVDVGAHVTEFLGGEGPDARRHASVRLPVLAR
jgi:hypothetical protein